MHVLYVVIDFEINVSDKFSNYSSNFKWNSYITEGIIYQFIAINIIWLYKLF